jgi:creatinine deaminase
MDDFMKAAMEEAKLGMSEGGIPIGSVLVKDGKIIGRGHNRRVQNSDPTAHGEIDCLRNAGRIGSYKNTILYSTLMPCALCAGAIVQFQIPKIIAGENRSFQSSRFFMQTNGVDVVDLNLDECHKLMQDFIKAHPDVWKEDIGEL